MLRPTLLLAATLVLTGCAADSASTRPGARPGTDGPVPTPTATGQPGDELRVTVSRGPGGPRISWILRCDPPGGTHPRAAQACRALARAEDPFGPVPQDSLCTQVYGGPQVARIEGSYAGSPVQATYRRTDGCEISRWEALRPVLGPAGVDRWAPTLPPDPD